MRDYPFKTVVVHKDVKNSRIRIGPDCTVYVTVPRGVDPGRLIESRKNWIFKKIESINCLADSFESGDGSFLYNGRMWHPVFSSSRGTVFSWPDIHYSSVSGLRRHITGEMKDDLFGRLDKYARTMGVEYGRISIRSQRTRWGSCSGKGNLNFNIRMMALPADARDYLVVHELAHRLEMNHSPAFWEIVGRHYPCFRETEKELRAYWIAIERNKIWKAILG